MQQTSPVLNIAVCSYGLDTHLDFELFAQKLDKIILTAASHQVDVILLPELFVADLLTGFQPKKNWDITELRSEQKQFEAIAKNFTPLILNQLEKLAIQYKITIVAGSMPRLISLVNPLDNSIILNSCPVVFPNGKIIFQDKLFLTRHEKSPWGWQPGNDIQLLSIPTRDGGCVKAVVNICFDVEFPGISQLITEYAPEVIFVPSCTSADYGFKRVRWCVQARAIEHYAFVASTGTVGAIATPGFDTNEGQAVILSPSEEGFRSPLVEGIKNQHDIIYGSLDIGLLRKKRKETSVFPSQQQLVRTTQIKTVSHN